MCLRQSQWGVSEVGCAGEEWDRLTSNPRPSTSQFSQASSPVSLQGPAGPHRASRTSPQLPGPLPEASASF